MNKTLTFEYLLFQLIGWYSQTYFETSSSPESINMIQSKFSRLASLKLLFFTSTIKDEQGKDLLDIFNHYCAMQYGPVESDIYSDIVANKTTFYKLDPLQLLYKQTNITEDSFNQLSESTRQSIRTSVELLKKENNKLITYKSSKLVNISHKWTSWQEAMTLAEMLGKRSEKMSVDSIRNSVHYYE